MGRDLYWYVLPRAIEHETSKELCFQYEYEEDENVVISHVYEKVTGECSDFDFTQQEGESRAQFFERMKQHKNKVDTIAYEYKWDDEHKDKWCAKCSMFANGIFQNRIIIDKAHIGHSYSSPYWASSWSIRNFVLGTSQSKFVSLFKNDHMYSEVTQYYVQWAKEQLEELGDPLRQSDKEAYEETMIVINFLDKWTRNADVIVIMDDEC